MTLPFLTAGSETGAFEADGEAPAHGLRDHWRRPYRPGPWRVAGGAVLLLIASYLLFSALIIAFAGGTAGAWVCLAVAVAVIAFALRLLHAGVWVSSQGLRRAGLLTTVTLPWHDVESVRTTQQPVRWLGLPRTVQGQALAVLRVSGPREPRTLLTDHNADFLGRREAFERAADVVEGWAAESR